MRTISSTGEKMKKGQMYIFAAVILCILAVTLLGAYSRVDTPDPAVRQLQDNFVYESRQVINQAFVADEEVDERFDTFVADYIDYVKSRNLRFLIAYAISRENTTRIVNLLNEQLIVVVGGNETALDEDDSLTIGTPDSFSLSVGGRDYEYNITPTPDIQVKLLMRFEER